MAVKPWVVTGTLPVRGHQPGEEFEEAIPERQAKSLVAAGALTPGKRSASGAKKSGSGKRSASGESGEGKAPPTDKQPDASGGN